MEFMRRIRTSGSTQEPVLATIFHMHFAKSVDCTMFLLIDCRTSSSFQAVIDRNTGKNFEILLFE